MHAKFILRRPNGTKAQVAITADATASVADLARALVTSDPDLRTRPRDDVLTLKLEHLAVGGAGSGRRADDAPP